MSDWSVSSPAAHHAVHVLGDKVDRAVGDAEVDLDLGILGMKLRQRGKDDQQGQGRTDIDADRSFQAGLRHGHAAVEFIDVGKQTHRPLVVGSAVRRDGHAPCRPVEQFGVNVRLQRLDELASLSALACAAGRPPA